jgi:hypothetical protein
MTVSRGRLIHPLKMQSLLRPIPFFPKRESRMRKTEVLAKVVHFVILKEVKDLKLMKMEDFSRRSELQHLRILTC